MLKNLGIAILCVPKEDVVTAIRLHPLTPAFLLTTAAHSQSHRATWECVAMTILKVCPRWTEVSHILKRLDVELGIQEAVPCDALCWCC